MQEPTLQRIDDRTQKPCQDKAIYDRHTDVQQAAQMFAQDAAVKHKIIGSQTADDNQQRGNAPVEIFFIPAKFHLISPPFSSILYH